MSSFSLSIRSSASSSSSHYYNARARVYAIIIIKMNTAPTALYQNAPSSSSSRTVYSADDMENATLLQKNVESSSKKNSSMSLKNVAYGLGIVALACSGSFVAGRSAARYKLSSSSGSGGSSTQLGAVARLGSSSSATSKKHSTAHLAAGKKAAKKAASSSEEEEEDAPADPESMTKEEMAEEIKQLRGYMTSLVDEDEVRILR